MNLPLLAEFFSNLVAVSWRAGALIFVLAALRWLVRGRIPAQLWFVVWIVVALRLLLPFSVPVAQRGATSSTSQSMLVSSASVSIPASATNPSQPTLSLDHEISATTLAPATAGAPITRWTWTERLLAVWLAGVAILGVTRLVASLLFRARLRHATPVSDPRWFALVAEESTRAGLRRALVSLETDGVDAPAIAGWWTPRLLLPPGLVAQLADDELRFVLRHELAHWRRRDLLVQGLVQAALVLHWFNPAVWLAARLARADCELACDESVLAREPSERAPAYGAALLRVLRVVAERPRPLAVVGLLENRRQLAARIRRIADYRAAGFFHRAGGVIIVSVVAFAATASFTRKLVAAEPAVRPPAPPAAETLSAERPALTTDNKVTAAADETKALQSLSESVAAQREKVERLASALLDYKTKNQVSRASLDARSQAFSEALKLSGEALSQATLAFNHADLRMKQLIEYRAKRLPVESMTIFTTTPVYRLTMENIDSIRRALAALNPAENDERPQVIKLKASLAKEEATRAEVMARIEAQNETNYETAKRKLDEATLAHDKLKQGALELDREALVYTNLERDLKVQAEVLRAIADRLRDPTGWPTTGGQTVSAVAETLRAVDAATAVPDLAAAPPAAGPSISSSETAAGTASTASLAPELNRLTANPSAAVVTRDPVSVAVEPTVTTAPDADRPIFAFVMVDGAVGRAELPKPVKVSFQPRHGINLLEAIAKAGSFNRLADIKHVRLTRRDANGIVTVRVIDMQAVLRGEDVSMALQAGDSILVPERVVTTKK